MPFIHGVFLVNFGQPPLIVLNLLPESQRCFFGIHFLEVTGKPAGPSGNVQPVTPPTAGQFFPVFEFLFVLRPRAHCDLRLTAAGIANGFNDFHQSRGSW